MSRPETKWDTLHSSKKQDWATPQALFDGLSKRFGPFDLDAAAGRENRKCKQFFSDYDDALIRPWTIYTKRLSAHPEDPSLGECFGLPPIKTVWLNPPYGRDIGRWLRKAADEASKGCHVVCLVPSRTGSRWFRDAVSHASKVFFIVGRITFDGAPSPAPFDSAVIVFDFSDKVPQQQIDWITREELYK